MKTLLRLLALGGKVLLLAAVALMASVQIPELLYDFGSGAPVEITGPDQLSTEAIPATVFAVVRGTPDFDNAFVYRRYGLDHHYFTVKPYGLRLVVRTYEPITDEWRSMNSFVGRLRPFDRQPFSRYIAAIYRDRFGVTVPDDAYFLALGDVPRPSAWQVGGLLLAGSIWCALFWVFFLRRRSARTPTGAAP